MSRGHVAGGAREEVENSPSVSLLAFPHVKDDHAVGGTIIGESDSVVPYSKTPFSYDPFHADNISLLLCGKPVHGLHDALRIRRIKSPQVFMRVLRSEDLPH